MATGINSTVNTTINGSNAEQSADFLANISSTSIKSIQQASSQLGVSQADIIKALTTQYKNPPQTNYPPIITNGQTVIAPQPQPTISNAVVDSNPGIYVPPVNTGTNTIIIPTPGGPTSIPDLSSIIPSSFDTSSITNMLVILVLLGVAVFVIVKLFGG